MKLLVLDVEGTIFHTKTHIPGLSLSSTLWQAIAVELGSNAVSRESETHERWEAGRYHSYLDWMKDTISIHKHFALTSEMFQQLIRQTEYNLDVVETLSCVERTEYEPVLISGGFKELAERAQRDLGINHAFSACEYFFDESGHLQGYNLLPCDFEGKIDFINLLLREYDLNDDDWVFVGDGLNDVPIARKAPVSIGYRPHPELRAVVTYSIEEFSDLLSILELAEKTKTERTKKN